MPHTRQWRRRQHQKYWTSHWAFVKLRTLAYTKPTQPKRRTETQQLRACVGKRTTTGRCAYKGIRRKTTTHISCEIESFLRKSISMSPQCLHCYDAVGLYVRECVSGCVWCECTYVRTILQFWYGMMMIVRLCYCCWCCVQPHNRNNVPQNTRQKC